eukprot:3479171-Pyramimonas_sp.AAC.1
MLQTHYEATHSVRDPVLTTVASHQCPDCLQRFGWEALLVHRRRCPAKLEFRRQLQAEVGQWVGVESGPHPEPPSAWWIATDGSAKEYRAGWGAVIFRHEGPGAPSMVPAFVLRGPVVVQARGHRWLGAREETNNTRELSAIGEVSYALVIGGGPRLRG